MNRLPPKIAKVSECLLAYETRENHTQAIRTPAACLVCEKLRPALSNLMGHSGFRALLARALALTNTEASWPGTVQVRADGTLGGWDALEEKITRAELAETSVVLVARLIGLLVAFIGEELTFRLLRDVWPEIELRDGILTTETS